MSLAFFIKNCLSEEKYGTEYTSHLDDRVQSLNFAQLEGMQSVLTSAIADAKSGPWRTANQTILDRVNFHIKPKREEVLLNEKKLEAKKREARVKRVNAEAKVKETEFVMNQIKMKAEAQAIEDIREAEFKRQVAEKQELMMLVPQAEERRWKYVKYGCLWFVLVVVGVSVALTNPLFIAAGIVFAMASTAYIFRRAYLTGIVTPAVVTEEDLQRQREIRKEELIQKAMNTLKLKEIEYNNKAAKEEEERIRAKLQRQKERDEAIKVSDESKEEPHLLESQLETWQSLPVLLKPIAELDNDKMNAVKIAVSDEDMYISDAKNVPAKGFDSPSFQSEPDGNDWTWQIREMV